MQNNFQPVNLKNAKRHLDWLINKTSENNRTEKTKISTWRKILNAIAKIF